MIVSWPLKTIRTLKLLYREMKNSKTSIYVVHCNLRHQKDRELVFYFFVRNLSGERKEKGKGNLSRVAWTVLAFLSHNNNRESLHFTELADTFLSVDQLSVFFPLRSWHHREITLGASLFLFCNCVMFLLMPPPGPLYPCHHHYLLPLCQAHINCSSNIPTVSGFF